MFSINNKIKIRPAGSSQAGRESEINKNKAFRVHEIFFFPKSFTENQQLTIEVNYGR